MSPATSQGSSFKKVRKAVKDGLDTILCISKSGGGSQRSSTSTLHPSPPPPPSPTLLEPSATVEQFPSKGEPLRWKDIEEASTLLKERLWATVPHVAWATGVEIPGIEGVHLPEWATHGVQTKAREFRESEEMIDKNIPDDLSVHERSMLAKLTFTPRTTSGASKFTKHSAFHKGTRTLPRSTSTKHLESWIKRQRGTAECDVTGAGYPCLATHIIENRYSIQARLSIYFALRGWISPNSRINYLYLRTDIQFRLDERSMLVYIKDEGIINKIENDYIPLVSFLKPDDLAFDWLSLLRTHHPDLCDGNSFEYSIASRKGIPTDIGPRTDIVGLTFPSYAHPLTILVRLCVLLDELSIELKPNNSEYHWATFPSVVDTLLEKFSFPEDQRQTILDNIRAATSIYALMPKPFPWFHTSQKGASKKGKDDEADSQQGDKGGRKGDKYQTVFSNGGTGGRAKDSGGFQTPNLVDDEVALSVPPG